MTAPPPATASSVAEDFAEFQKALVRDRLFGKDSRCTRAASATFAAICVNASWA
jgi:hypothetical protein